MNIARTQKLLSAIVQTLRHATGCSRLPRSHKFLCVSRMISSDRDKWEKPHGFGHVQRCERACIEMRRESKSTLERSSGPGEL